MRALLLGVLILVSCSSTEDWKKGYPEHWWASLPKEEVEWWEVPPDAAKEGEVILSKRNELGVLSNFSAHSFTYRGKKYPGIEGIWQAMKYPENKDDPRAKHPGITWKHSRKEVEQMVGFEAKAAGDAANENMKAMGIKWVTFEGKRLEYWKNEKGEHYQIIRGLMAAKLNQNLEIQKILLSTGNLELLPDHEVSPTVPPAWKYNRIYMEFRELLKKGQEAK